MTSRADPRFVPPGDIHSGVKLEEPNQDTKPNSMNPNADSIRTFAGSWDCKIPFKREGELIPDHQIQSGVTSATVVDSRKLKARPKHRDDRMNELFEMKVQQQIETYSYVVKISVERNETLQAENESLKRQLAAKEAAARESRSRSI
ncbi:hypothetical protein FMEXI_4981 [Fusarium mexicanum]|uniref:Uncharacterized protein n=1 Tax=Fusarium mexicanum TaxID=751941 RepID=A0A8H5N0Z1_9HYPO|nr:hypothetical protein FMEXI_4981 [Fusarium mexicanum]